MKMPTITVVKEGDWWCATPSFLTPGYVTVTGCDSKKSAEDAEQMLRQMLLVNAGGAEQSEMDLGI